MKDDTSTIATIRNFGEALRRGDVKGYAVCAKPLRFSKLPDIVATTFAQMGEENCYYVFQSETDAIRKMEEIPAADRLGWIFSVREVIYLATIGKNDGPKLDIYGYPMAMRGFLVDATGAATEWTRPGRFGWKGPSVEDADAPPAAQPAPRYFDRVFARMRQLFKK